MCCQLGTAAVLNSVSTQSLSFWGWKLGKSNSEDIDLTIRFIAAWNYKQSTISKCIQNLCNSLVVEILYTKEI
jgi:hypothetical protein